MEKKKKDFEKYTICILELKLMYIEKTVDIKFLFTSD